MSYESIQDLIASDDDDDDLSLLSDSELEINLDKFSRKLETTNPTTQKKGQTEVEIPINIAEHYDDIKQALPEKFRKIMSPPKNSNYPKKKQVDYSILTLS